VKLIKLLSYAAFVYAILGYYNESYFGWVNSVLLSSHSIEIAIVIFGVWRIAVEKVSYVRIRIAVLTGLIATIWLMFPLLTGSTFFDNHLIGTTWFFAYLLVIFLFGRRADCGWNCACAGIRDTAGDPFRRSTIRGENVWGLRHVKWIPLSLMLIYLFLWAFYPSASLTFQYESIFGQIFLGIFCASLLVVPVTGNRNYCRFLCPWGALYGLIGTLGFFKIEADREKCIDCGACDKNCEMGVPVSSLVKKDGQVKVSDCVGCGRCISTCPTKALEFRDVRSYLRKTTASSREISPLVVSKEIGART
jgi:polyferredoxin